MQHQAQRTERDTVSREIARHCVLTRVRQISRALTAIYDEAMRPFGMVASQLTLLVLVAEFGPLSRSDLGRRNQHDRSTLTRNLQPVIAQGWIAEGVAAADGRSRPLSLTETGSALLESAVPAWSAAQARATALLGEGGTHALMHIASDLPPRLN